MVLHKLRFFWGLVLGLLLTGAAMAQSPEDKQFVVRSFDEVVKERTSYEPFHFQFPNLNRVFSYRDPAKLKKILELEREGKFYEMLPLMEQYVGSFGIQNFYNETRMLWRLGQLYEKLGQESKAKSMYRLILKHHRGTVDTLRRYYDKLNAGFADNYVSLKFYYDLVEYRKHIDTLRPPREVYINMGEGINSKTEDYGPALSAADDTLIFSSKRNRLDNGRVNEDLFFSTQKYGYWMDAEPIKELNSNYNEGSAIVSKDGKRVYFTRCDAPEGYGNCDIYYADWDARRKIWTNITNLGANVNGKGWDSQPALSPTEDTLYFASNRLGGFGMSDIWFSVRSEGTDWGIAQNMGPVINTRKNEASPFMFRENNVLYFSSDGHIVNFGNFDIYKSYLRGGRYQEPRNIGPLVNGGGNEYYFTIDSKAKNLYYARSEDSTVRNLDLYSFALPMDAQPRATTVFGGRLTDSTGKPFAGIVSVIDIDNGIEVAPKFLRPDGSFDFDLINNNNYLLIIQGDEFFRIEEKFFLKTDTFIDRRARSIKNVKISFPSLEFLEASAEILPSMYNDLNNIRNFLLDNPNCKLKIDGHTDQKGNKQDNLLLSKHRAEAIKKYLMETGQVKTRRIEASGFGSAKPLILNEKTDEQRRINRRVEFTIIVEQRSGDLIKVSE
jgi:hypothetical protein